MLTQQQDNRLILPMISSQDHLLTMSAAMPIVTASEALVSGDSATFATATDSTSFTSTSQLSYIGDSAALAASGGLYMIATDGTYITGVDGSEAETFVTNDGTIVQLDASVLTTDDVTVESIEDNIDSGTIIVQQDDEQYTQMIEQNYMQ